MKKNSPSPTLTTLHGIKLDSDLYYEKAMFIDSYNGLAKHKTHHSPISKIVDLTNLHNAK